MLPRPGKLPGLFRFPYYHECKGKFPASLFSSANRWLDRILRLTFANARENTRTNDRNIPCQNCHAVNYASKCVAEEIFNGIL